MVKKLPDVSFHPFFPPLFSYANRRRVPQSLKREVCSAVKKHLNSTNTVATHLRDLENLFDTNIKSATSAAPPGVQVPLPLRLAVRLVQTLFGGPRRA